MYWQGARWGREGDRETAIAGTGRWSYKWVHPRCPSREELGGFSRVLHGAMGGEHEHMAGKSGSGWTAGAAAVPQGGGRGGGRRGYGPGGGRASPTDLTTGSSPT